MQIQIEHDTIFRYAPADEPMMQALRVWPTSSSSQTITEWQVQIGDRLLQARYKDGFGNYLATHTATSEAAASDTVQLSVRGRVQTFARDGVHQGEEPLPPVFFLCGTDLTMAGPAIIELACQGVRQSSSQRSSDSNVFDRLCRLVDTLRSRMDYVSARSGSEVSAEQALARGAGRAQEHAHVLIAAVQSIGFPARFVSGYLRTVESDRATMHEWTEIFLPDRGWVGFDAVNRCTTDDRYVRVASGRDMRDAAPVRAVTTGRIAEPIEITSTVKTAAPARQSRTPSMQTQQQSQQQSSR